MGLKVGGAKVYVPGEGVVPGITAGEGVGEAVGALEGVPGTTVGEGVETLVEEVEGALKGVPPTIIGEGVGTLWWERPWDCWQDRECSGPQWEKDWVKHAPTASTTNRSRSSSHHGLTETPSNAPAALPRRSHRSSHQQSHFFSNQCPLIHHAHCGIGR
jgi:hypothetical protein